MFERRLKILLMLLAVPAMGILLRLLQMQVVHADDYATSAKAMQTKPRVIFPCLRGEIQDHEGRRLAHDAPAWDLCVRYEILADDARYLRGLKRTPGDVEASWEAISRVTGLSVGELRERGESRYREVRRIKAEVANANGYEMEIGEERSARPIVIGMDQNQATRARTELAAYPWVEVVGSHARRYQGGESVGHLLGYLNKVDADDIANDPRRDDELARYTLNDLHGSAGVEALAEETLRGRRGVRMENEQGTTLIEPIDGQPFRLTIDLELQQIVYDKLAAAVADIPSATGASAVIIDVPTREVVALVSYPGYDPNISPQDRVKLEADEKYRPLKFRAVTEVYAPGSTIKPLVLLGALSDGKISTGTVFKCYGHLLPDDPTQWRCLGHHLDVDAISAIQRSCNVYFYHVGEIMQVPRLAWWMERAGIGRVPGTGLPREAKGSLPAGTHKGDARHSAIGQGAVTVSPLQVANMVASIASGVYRPVTIWADDPRPRPAEPLGASRAALEAVRMGMYRAVNVRGGTGYDHIHLNNLGDLVLLGKTGSAEAGAGWIVERIFLYQYPDGTKDELVAANEVDLALRYPKARGGKILEKREYQRFPPQEMDPTHAWFVGYITAKDRYLESSAGGKLNVAFAVLIEYGGRGGAVAAPAAEGIVQAMIDMQQGPGQEQPETDPEPGEQSAVYESSGASSGPALTGRGEP